MFRSARKHRNDAVAFGKTNEFVFYRFRFKPVSPQHGNNSNNYNTSFDSVVRFGKKNKNPNATILRTI